MFVGSHPFEGDGVTGQSHRQQGGIQGRIVGTIMTVTACSFPVNYMNIRFFHPQNMSNGRPRRKDALRLCPNGQLAVFILRQRRRWASEACIW